MLEAVAGSAFQILFFAPGLFFNIRRVFHEYEIDTAAGAVRYRDNPGDPWATYQPSAEEKERARAHFAAHGQ